MSEKLISVIIPAYNAEWTLPVCLESVLSQALPAGFPPDAMEVIVVDDGSRDGTLAEAEHFAALDARVIAVHQENSGVTTARNTGLKRCSGRYIRFVDADDRLPADSLKCMLERIEAEQSDLIIAGYDMILGKLRRTRNLEDRDDTVPNRTVLERLNRWANTFFYGVLWNKLFRADIIRSLDLRFRGGLNWGEDFAFVAGYLEKAETISYMRASVYEYRRNPEGLTFKQTLDCVRHPIENCKMKWILYTCLRILFQARGMWKEYRPVLWRYLIRTTIDQ